MTVFVGRLASILESQSISAFWLHWDNPISLIDWSAIWARQVFVEKDFEVFNEFVAVFSVAPLLQEIVCKHFIENCLVGNILIVSDI